MALSATLKASVTAQLTGSATVGSTAHQISEGYSLALTDGTAANQANNVYAATFSVSASGSTDLDLAGGLTNALGASLTFTAIKAIYIEADSTNTNNVVVGGDANAFNGPLGGTTPTLTIPPGGAVLLTNPSADGWTVTAGTGDVLQIANSGAGSAVTGTIVIIGEA